MTSDHEKGNDESFNDYLIRLSKIPSLPKDTLMRLLFLPGDSALSNMKLDGWINVCFSGDISESITNPTYPTVDFVEWVHRESILDRWKSLGEERASTANQFIELFIGDGTDSTSKNSETNIASTNNPIKREDALTFYRVDKTWRVGFAETKNIPHTKGMTYYQHLFLHPNESYSSLDIQILGNKKDINFIKETNIFHDDPKYTPPQDEPEKDSDTIKKELKDRYLTYKRAEDEGSLDVDLLKDEYEDLLKLHNSLYDLHGKARDSKAPEERARKAVAKNLKITRRNIVELLPELEGLLKDIKTGNSPSYTPSNPDKPIKIITRQGK